LTGSRFVYPRNGYLSGHALVHSAPNQLTVAELPTTASDTINPELNAGFWQWRIVEIAPKQPMKLNLKRNANKPPFKL
jgi:hypothetical protein